MKLKFTDWEIEKEFCEDFEGYDYRYGLDEIINEDKITHKCSARLVLRTNDYSDIIRKIGELAMDDNNGKIEFVENKSLLNRRGYSHE